MRKYKVLGRTTDGEELIVQISPEFFESIRNSTWTWQDQNTTYSKPREYSARAGWSRSSLDRPVWPRSTIWESRQPRYSKSFAPRDASTSRWPSRWWFAKDESSYAQSSYSGSRPTRSDASTWVRSSKDFARPRTRSINKPRSKK